ncbi:MFS transporter [Candidatus Finniella inopinata]|uniref:MFS transporter n=1 Tax=Candidatus Finniella inopinata TaxID=1696036 RepID=A0A4Q7DHE6_9PROT|nr:MFS transporter [Candidatus Finniella inopinata]RZI45455.1 MFS transporter [Candidatus Finniella inopinata]
MGILSSLNREQKEAVGLLQIGTFLEYFDLMLYVHMAVLLNELFFPKTDPHTASLITAFAFCSTYVLRPFGALIFGWIGDNIGRKSTVIITTTMMAISCMLMANLPTYAQIGISAAFLVTLCRIIQGLSSMGEIIGAQIYITEITKPPYGYPAVAAVSVASSVGAMAAVGVAALTTSFGFGWRCAFWIGACVAVVGSIARTRLRETPEFVDIKLKLKILAEQCKNKGKAEKLLREGSIFWKEKISNRTLLGYFFIQCGWSLTFYLVFIYFSPTLKNVYQYTPENVISHNFALTLVQVIQAFVWCYLSFYVHPLKILKTKSVIFLFLMLLVPLCLFVKTGVWFVFLLQSLILVFHIGTFPAEYAIYNKFPVYKRFTACSFFYALGRAITYPIVSFGTVYMADFFGHCGILLVTVPLALSFLWGVRHFEKLEGLQPDTISNPLDDAVSSHAA